MDWSKWDFKKNPIISILQIVSKFFLILCKKSCKIFEARNIYICFCFRHDKWLVEQIKTWPAALLSLHLARQLDAQRVRDRGDGQWVELDRLHLAAARELWAVSCWWMIWWVNVYRFDTRPPPPLPYTNIDLTQSLSSISATNDISLTVSYLPFIKLSGRSNYQ